MFQSGDEVYYKKYYGIVFRVYENKTCDILLYNYRGFDKTYKQIEQYLLSHVEYEQISL